MLVYGVWQIALKRWHWIDGRVFHTPHRNVAVVHEGRLQRQARNAHYRLCRLCDLGISRGELEKRVWWEVREIGPDGLPVALETSDSQVPIRPPPTTGKM